MHPLDNFAVEIPSWGFGDTGTRFGKFLQAAAARTFPEKLADAALVHRLTGCCPRVAVHDVWDFPLHGPAPGELADQARALGVRIGSVNPNLFEEQIYKYGSLASPDPAARRAALARCGRGIEILRATGSDVLSLWLADGTNYPGQDDCVARKHRLQDGFRRVHDDLAAARPDAFLFIEYKPFEPAFYLTDVADWGYALLYCRRAGPRARVLVDTGHHFQGQNVEHIVATLLDEEMLGGFHFNDRRYADDDLTFGSIDPYQAFRIFHELHNDLRRRAAARGTGDAAEAGAGPAVAPLYFTVDQSHNLKPKIEAMLQTVDTAQRLWLKAARVDRDALAAAQTRLDLVGAEMILKRAFDADVEGELLAWRRQRGLPADPVAALRESDEVPRRERERGLNAKALSTYG